MSRVNIFGWVGMTVGFVVWLYGYFTTGHPPLVDWSVFPDWISEFVPNFEAEAGFAIMVLAAIPAYWPSSKRR